MFKILIYAYSQNIYSSRKIETACKRDINFMWLLAGQKAQTTARLPVSVPGSWQMPVKISSINGKASGEKRRTVKRNSIY